MRSHTDVDSDRRVRRNELRASYKDARDQRLKDAIELLTLWLHENEDAIDEVARFLDYSSKTILRWQSDEQLPRATLIPRIEGFLRSKNVMPELKLGENPSIAEALEYGFSMGLFTIPQVLEAVDTIHDGYTLMSYASGQETPTVTTRLRLQWYLHNITINDDGAERPLMKMAQLERKPPELVGLLRACGKGELTPAAIANQLNVPIVRVNAWLTSESCIPKSNVLQRITEEFAPFLHDSASSNVNGKREQDGDQSSTPVSSRPERRAKAKRAIRTPPEDRPSLALPITDGDAEMWAEPEDSPSPTIQTAAVRLTQTTPDVILEIAELLRCLLVGYVGSRQPSKAVTELESLRTTDPNLWFELSLSVGVVADPSERYAAWKKSRR